MVCSPPFSLKAYSSGYAVGQPLQYYVNMLQGEARKRREAQRIQRQLDEALSDTFPASDPVAIVTSHHEEDWGEEYAEPRAPDALKER
jgi:hypothetical protein